MVLLQDPVTYVTERQQQGCDSCQVSQRGGLPGQIGVQPEPLFQGTQGPAQGPEGSLAGKGRGKRQGLAHLNSHPHPIHVAPFCSHLRGQMVITETFPLVQQIPLDTYYVPGEIY